MYGSCFLCDIFFGGGERRDMSVCMYIYVNFKKKLL